MNSLFESVAWLLLSFFVSTGMAVLALMYGWGLEPVRWDWIIGAGMIGTIFGKLLSNMAGKELLQHIRELVREEIHRITNGDEKH